MAFDHRSSFYHRGLATISGADAVGSIFSLIDQIHWAIAAAKHNKTYVLQFSDVVKKIVKVLNGADSKFIRQAEFFSDLKETLQKIELHTKDCSTRGKWMNKLMGKKDQKSFEEFKEHIDILVTRIVFSFAQRVRLMNLSQKKPKPEVEGKQMVQYCANISPIVEVEEEEEDDFRPCSLAIAESFESLTEDWQNTSEEH